MIKIGRDGIYIGDRFLPLISGSVQYFRLQRDKWSEILDRVKEMGFSIIETYIPWSVHEIEKGKFDFGEINKNYDISHFLSLCFEKNIYVLIRPGPHINAELTYFGYPKRIFSDRDILARDANGALVYLPSPPRMFPVPSYASEKFYEEVEIYFEALSPIIKKYIFPEGPVIGIQIDNEMSFFFRTSAYDQDYCSDSIKLYRIFLEEKYKDIENLNKIYNTDFASFSEVEPPRDYCREKEKIYYHLDWCEFKEYYLVRAIERIASMWKKKGIKDIFVFHNYPTPFPTSPFNIIEVEKKIDIQAIDYYPTKENYPQIKKGVSFVSTLSRFPFVAEFSSGFTFIGPPIFLEDQKFTTLSLFMHGIKGVNFYMIVERERWYGSPVKRDGKIREEYFEFYKRLNKFIKETGIYKFNKKKEIIILLNPEYERLKLATSLFSPIPLEFISSVVGIIPTELLVSEDNLGFSTCIQKEYDKFWETLYKEFSKNGYCVDLGTVEIDSEKLFEYKLIVLPTFDFLKEEIQNKFKNMIEEGATVLTGPKIPQINKIPLNFSEKPLIEIPGKYSLYFKNYGRGKIIHLEILSSPSEEDCKKIIEKVSGISSIRKYFFTEDKFIDIVLQEHLAEKILYVANPSDKEREFEIEFEGKFLFREIFWNSGEFSGENKVKLKISPWTILIFEVREC